MAKPIDKAEAEALYNRLGLTVDKVRVDPRQHKGNVLFVGYADIHLFTFENGIPIPLITLCGNSIKMIGDQLHFDPKSERGKGDRASDYFPHWYPKTGAVRAVITHKLGENAQIQEMVATALGRLSETAGVSS